MRRIILAVFALCLSTSVVFAQQDAQFTMHPFNRQVINPAYAGAIDGIHMTLLGRSQWVGFPGQPQTMTASVSAPLEVLHGGIGGYLIGDQLGPWGTLGARVAYAFRLDLGDTKLRIGVDGGVYQKSINADWVYNDDNGVDPILGQASGTNWTANTLVPDIGAGIYLHKPLSDPTGTYAHDKWYLGIAGTHLLEPSMDDLLPGGAAVSSLNLSRGLTAHAGYTFETGNPNFKIQPNVIAKYNFASLQLDANLNFYISPLVFGLHYRGFSNVDAASASVGFNATKNLFIAYAYDYTLSEVGGFTTGSHELILSYTIFTADKRRPWDEGTKLGSGWND